MRVQEGGGWTDPGAAPPPPPHTLTLAHAQLPATAAVSPTPAPSTQQLRAVTATELNGVVPITSTSASSVQWTAAAAVVAIW